MTVLLSNFSGYGEDCYRHYESILFGSIPIVNNHTGLNPIFKQAPMMVITDWENPPTKKDLLAFQIPTKSRKVLMYQYWHDQIVCVRNRLIKHNEWFCLRNIFWQKNGLYILFSMKWVNLLKKHLEKNHISILVSKDNLYEWIIKCALAYILLGIYQSTCRVKIHPTGLNWH